MAIHPNGTNDIQINTIAERTAGVGVTIDGLRVKDNGLDAVAATDCPIGINGTVKWRFRSTAFDLVPETDNDVKIGDSVGPKRLSAVHSRNFYGGGGSMSIGTTDDQTVSLIQNNSSVITIDTDQGITVAATGQKFKFANGNDSWFGLSVDPSLAATGSTSADAAPIDRMVTVVSTVAASTGVILPDTGTTSGSLFIITNFGANTLTVYPHSGGNINTAASISVPTGDMLIVIRVGSTTWAGGVAPG